MNRHEVLQEKQIAENKIRLILEEFFNRTGFEVKDIELAVLPAFSEHQESVIGKTTLQIRV